MSDFLHPEREPGGLLELSRLIARADAMGWEWFDQLESAGGRLDQKQVALGVLRSQRLGQALARLAALDDFKLLLEHLVDTTILQPTQYVALGLPIDQAALNTARREGENALVWRLLKLIAEGRKAPVGPFPEAKNATDIPEPAPAAVSGRSRRRRKPAS